MENTDEVEEFAYNLCKMFADDFHTETPMFFKTIARNLIDIGYRKSPAQPLVHLDRKEIEKTLENMPCICHTNYQGDRKIIADFICSKFATKPVNIPTEKINELTQTIIHAIRAFASYGVGARIYCEGVDDAHLQRAINAAKDINAMLVEKNK